MFPIMVVMNKGYHKQNSKKKNICEIPMQSGKITGQILRNFVNTF